MSGHGRWDNGPVLGPDMGAAPALTQAKPTPSQQQQAQPLLPAAQSLLPAAWPAVFCMTESDTSHFLRKRNLVFG